jgi:hypothetical protein
VGGRGVRVGVADRGVADAVGAGTVRIGGVRVGVTVGFGIGGGTVRAGGVRLGVTVDIVAVAGGNVGVAVAGDGVSVGLGRTVGGGVRGLLPSEPTGCSAPGSGSTPVSLEMSPPSAMVTSPVLAHGTSSFHCWKTTRCARSAK